MKAINEFSNKYDFFKLDLFLCEARKDLITTSCYLTLLRIIRILV
jgi:hypothetical protein